MVYVKQNWADGPEGETPISATRLLHMEDGIEDASDRATALEEFDAGLATVATTGQYTDMLGTIPEADLPPIALSVAGKTGDITLEIPDIEGLEDALNEGGGLPAAGKTGDVLVVDNAITGGAKWVVPAFIHPVSPGLTNPGALTDYEPGTYVINVGGSENSPVIYENLYVDEIDVRADYIIIRNCKILGGDTSSVIWRVGWDDTMWLRNRVIEHCDISGKQMSGGGYTARYNLIHHSTNDGIQLDRSDEPTVIEDNLFTDFVPTPGSHCDGIQIPVHPRADVVIRRNRVLCAPPDGFTPPPDSPYNAGLFVDSYDIDIPEWDPDPTVLGEIWVEDNTFTAPLAAYVLRIHGDRVHLIRNRFGVGTAAAATITTTPTASSNVVIDADGDVVGALTNDRFIGESPPWLTPERAHSIYAPLNAAPVTLTDAATIATNAKLGDHFRVTLGGNRTLGNPTNMADGQRITWELIQDGTGSRTLALDTAFALGTDISSVVLSTAAGKRDFLEAMWNATAEKWHVLAFTRGY